MAQDADMIITTGLQRARKLEDPKGKSIEKVREIRDEIERRVQELVAEIAQT